MQVKYSRLKINDNFGSGENLLGKGISNLLAWGQLNWEKKILALHLHVFNFFPQLKTMHHLFKWCHRLKAVFSAVY